MMNNEKKTNWMYLAISVLLSIGIWIVADGTQSAKADTRIHDVPIEFIGEETILANRGLLLLDDSEKSVTLKLEGTRKAVADLVPDEVRVEVNLADVVTTGVQSVPYRIVYPDPASYFSANLTNVSDSGSVTINVGELSRKEIGITYDIRGNVAEGYIAGEVVFEPAVLEIQGQADEVEAVAYAHVVLNIDNAAETVVQTLDVILLDANEQPVTEHSLRLSSSQVQATMPVNVIRELPLAIDFLESAGSRRDNTDWELEPKAITVYGDAATLDGIDRILLDTVDLAALDGDMTFNYVIPLPDGCENLSGISRATLKLSFKDLLEEKREATQFRCEHQPAGKTVTVLTSRLSVTLRGTSADVKAVGPENITVVADLSDISSASGSYTVPAVVEIDTAGDVTAVGTYQIRVNISEPAPTPQENTPQV